MKFTRVNCAITHLFFVVYDFNIVSQSDQSAQPFTGLEYRHLLKQFTSLASSMFYEHSTYRVLFTPICKTVILSEISSDTHTVGRKNHKGKKSNMKSAKAAIVVLATLVAGYVTAGPDADKIAAT
ncbi:MAG: hypothetical protein IIW14_04235, partial [Kiritimatiellae bacterium]|nr:hypothetical protein [Kiritimatiellia bacterium]